MRQRRQWWPLVTDDQDEEDPRRMTDVLNADFGAEGEVQCADLLVAQCGTHVIDSHGQTVTLEAEVNGAARVPMIAGFYPTPHQVVRQIYDVIERFTSLPYPGDPNRALWRLDWFDEARFLVVIPPTTISSFMQAYDNESQVEDEDGGLRSFMPKMQERLTFFVERALPSNNYFVFLDPRQTGVYPFHKSRGVIAWAHPRSVVRVNLG